MHEEESRILSQAVDAASRLTGLEFSFEQAGIRDMESIDAVVTLCGQGDAVRWPAEVVRNLTAATFGSVTARVGNLNRSCLLIAPYINRNLAEKLKGLGVPFMDASGNLFINTPPYYIYVVGQARALDANIGTGFVFNPMSLKVVFTLLCMPERTSAAYRDIADLSGVSLGTVANTVAALERTGFIVDRGGRGRTLARVEELMRRWVPEYAERLRPKLLLGRFSPVEPTWRGMGGTDHYLGGETAAAILTGHLKPAMQTFFLKGELKDFAMANRLKKDPQGPVECLKAFWRFDYPWDHGHLAPPLIIYADLLASGDPRNIETAEIIHERFLAPRFERIR